MAQFSSGLLVVCVTVCLPGTIFEIFCVLEYRDLEV